MFYKIIALYYYYYYYYYQHFYWGKYLTQQRGMELSITRQRRRGGKYLTQQRYHTRVLTLFDLRGDEGTDTGILINKTRRRLILMLTQDTI